MAEILVNFNKMYGKFYDRNKGIKVYRSNFGGKFSNIAFKRASEAKSYKSRVVLRYMNLNIAYKAWLEEQNKPITRIRWIDRLFNHIKALILWLTQKMKHSMTKAQ
jgi:hypothetical protein